MKTISNKSVTRVLIWQTVSRFALSGISFITTPIFTRLLSTDDYGKFSNYNAWLAVLGIVVTLQTYGTIPNARVKYDSNEYKRYLSSIFTISIISVFLFLTVSILFRNFLGKILSIDSSIIPILVLNSFFSFIISFYSNKLVQEKEVEKDAIISLIISIATAICSIMLIKNFTDNRYVGRIVGGIIPLAVVGIVEIVIIYSKGRTLFEKTYWKYCLTLSIPLIFHGIGGLVLNISDRIMLTKIGGNSSTGIYSVAYSMGNIINIIWMAINNSWQPFYYDYKKRKDNSTILRKSHNYMVLFTALTCAFLLCVPEVFKIMVPEKYWSGLVLIPFVVMAYYFCFLYSFPSLFEFYHEKTKMISLGTIVSAISNVILNMLLIPRYAGLGAAIATTVSYLICFLIHYVNAAFIMKEKYEHSFAFLMSGLIVVMIVSVQYYFTLDFSVVRWIIALGIGILLIRKIIIRREIL